MMARSTEQEKFWLSSLLKDSPIRSSEFASRDMAEPFFPSATTKPQVPLFSPASDGVTDGTRLRTCGSPCLPAMRRHRLPARLAIYARRTRERASGHSRQPARPVTAVPAPAGDLPPCVLDSQTRNTATTPGRQ